MSRNFFRNFSLLPAIFSMGFAVSIFAQTDSASAPQTISEPPAPPAIKPPVDFFRELLALSPSQRDNVLKGRSPESKVSVLAKVREYESLDADERELRLRATE